MENGVGYNNKKCLPRLQFVRNGFYRDVAFQESNRLSCSHVLQTPRGKKRSWQVFRQSHKAMLPLATDIPPRSTSSGKKFNQFPVHKGVYAWESSTVKFHIILGHLLPYNLAVGTEPMQFINPFQANIHSFFFYLL